MKILVLPGDGIGPEITEATLTVLERANAKFRLGLEWDRQDIGLVTLKSQGSTLPESVMDAARKAPGIILGPVDHLQYPPREQGGINPSGSPTDKLKPVFQGKFCIHIFIIAWGWCFGVYG